MTAFETVFRRAYLAAQVRWSAKDYAERLGMYFRRLRFASLEELANGVAKWFDTNNKFPSIAEWRGVLPGGSSVGAPTGARVMGGSEIAEWNAAMKRICEGEPCSCFACVSAGVDHQPLRFVPIEDSDGIVKTWHGGRNEFVTAGEWIHGDSLWRWYAARDGFFATAVNVPVWLKRRYDTRVPLRERLDEIFKPRQPGEREPGEEG